MAEMNSPGIPPDGIAVIDPDTPTRYNPQCRRGLVARVILGPVWVDVTPEALHRLVDRAMQWLKMNAERGRENAVLKADDFDVAKLLLGEGQDINAAGREAAAELAAIIKAAR